MESELFYPDEIMTINGVEYVPMHKAKYLIESRPAPSKQALDEKEAVRLAREVAQKEYSYSTIDSLAEAIAKAICQHFSAPKQALDYNSLQEQWKKTIKNFRVPQNIDDAALQVIQGKPVIEYAESLISKYTTGKE